MALESQIPIDARVQSRRFATRLALFYGTLFGLAGVQQPFFPVWLNAIGISVGWIGVIAAVPAVARFTALPFITALAEKRQALHGALIVTAFGSAFGFAIVGTQHQAFAVFLAFVATCCLWTAMTPLTDAYALYGVARHGLNYGPLRLWGSAAFAAGALACGLLIDIIAANHLIWVIAAGAALTGLASLVLQPLEKSKAAAAGPHGAGPLLRDRGFVAVIATAALVQGSHAAYYTFASIGWQQAGFGGLTIAALWVSGVLAEIVLLALSPRFTLPGWVLVVIGALSAILRWVITAQAPPIAILAVVQLAHGLTFGLTLVGTMELLAERVPGHVVARGQGYLAASTGIVTSCASVASGALYARYGEGVYYLMAAMAAIGALTMWLARHRLTASLGEAGTR